ncbi:Trinucleotide repeat-containing gene 6B protein [Takifugu flavidus]|uniref:Trinucleotide repeat-containing gene 6B protein n=1 Tax=Takifugu flavidus TaxID=433684 RepID=A0A5C6NPY6_9TELE|nr:Trinucleotide repeat-containing gene 6B protein [Takifugu flavidus]
MEDKKKKKEDKKKKESSQKASEQKIKVIDPTCSQPLATPGSASPSPGPATPSSPTPGAAGVSAQVPPCGGNNAKQWTAVANGQPSSQTSQQQQRYMSREVPPRFRSQQDHKVLLKRGQPPLSSMLLGGGGEGEEGVGGNGGGSSWVATPPLSSPGTDNLIGNAAEGKDSKLVSSSDSSTNSSLSSLCVAALSSSSITTSTYANSTWGAGSSSLSSSQGCGKVTVDGTDLGDWPSIVCEAKRNSDEAKGGAQEQVYPSNNNSSASWGERNIQQKREDVGGGSENTDNPSSSRSSPLSSSSSLNECVQSSGGWGSTSSHLEAGQESQAFFNSKVSHLLPGPQESPVGVDSSLSSANFDPIVDSSSWPLLVPSVASPSANDGLPFHPSTPSSSSLSTATALVTTHSLSSLNHTGLQLKHTDTAVETISGEQQQNFESPVQDSGSDGEAQGAGPSQERAIPTADGEGSDNLSCISASSDSTASWRPMPPVSTELAAGASQADGWGGGGTVAQEGNVWGCVGKGDKPGWGNEATGGSNTTVVSQGAWDGSSSKAEWSGTAGGASLSILAIGARRGEDGSSGSTGSGGSVGIGDSVLEDSASPKFAIMTKARDNQKGMERENSAVVELGGQGGHTGSGDLPSPNGGKSIASSGGGGNDSPQTQEEGALNTHCDSKQTSSAEVALLGMLNRSDLDPRVLSNTGWGQTQIRQNVAWDLDSTRGLTDKNEMSTSSSSFSSANIGIVASQSPGYPTNSSSVGNDPSANTHTTSLNSGNDTARDVWDASQSTFVPHISGNRGAREDAEVKAGKPAGGWGDPPPEKPGKGWAGEDQEWGERNRGGNWGDFSKQSSGWRDVPDEKRGRTGGWQGNVEEGGSQRGGWGGGDAAGSKSQQEWGGANLHIAATQIPNSQVVPMKAPNQQPQGGPMPGGWNNRSSFGGGGPTPKSQNQSLGWTSGPIPQMSGAGGDSLEPSGWEEPSPQSISRKMEIDDGTSAWGDPTCFNKNVNLWDKNNAPSKPSHSLQAQPPRRQQGLHQSRESNPSNAGVGMWGGGAQSVDNGTAAWGQVSDATTTWADPDDCGKPSGWGTPSPSSNKPGNKSMEGWSGKGEASDLASRHPSWDEDEEGGGVWNSAGSQGSCSSFNSGGWGHTQGGKRGTIKSGGGDGWMNQVSRQFSNMGLLGDDPTVDKKMEAEKRGLSDYNGEMRRGGRGGGGYRMSSSKDMGSEMGPYGEKISGQGGFVGSGGGMSLPRGMHQPGMHPVNPTQGLRAQVPHQFLSAQVPGSMMKQMSSPGGNVGGVVGGVGSVGGVGGGVFPPQISPQQLAMLSNIYPHMQQFHLLARIMAILQQQRQQPGGVGGPAAGGGNPKLSPSHLGGGLSKQPMGDTLPHSGMGGALSDLHAKTQGMYSSLTPGGNLSGLDLGSMMGGMKDAGGQQSRFKWMMEGQSPAPSPPTTAFHKNGPLPSALKMKGGSPFSQYEMLGSDTLGIQSQGTADNWHRTPGSKMGNKSATSSWPPEFQPGVPWKGIQSSGDSQSDPYMASGSVLGSPGTSSLNDSDHQLLRDNIGPNPTLNTLLPSPGAWPYSASDSPLSNVHSTAKYSEYKPSWPPEPIGQNKLWRTNRNSSQLPRPPPGLTNPKQTLSSPWNSGVPQLGRNWGGAGINQDSRFGPGSPWNEGISPCGSCWLLLSNLTPQIDGSTLRTICMQHGPLLTFHLGLTQGSALIRYSSQQEAVKAQGALHMCVLGNTTILAEFVSEEEVARYFAHSQAEVGSSGASGASGTQGSSGTSTAGAISESSPPGNERAPPGPPSVGSINGSNGGDGGVVLGSLRSSGSAWQSLDGTGNPSESSSAQGTGLGIFSQWSTSEAGEGGSGSAVESGRAGLWGGMAPGYPSSSLWGAPQMEERHQMDNPAALLPGDLLGGGGDSI